MKATCVLAFLLAISASGLRMGDDGTPDMGEVATFRSEDSEDPEVDTDSEEAETSSNTGEDSQADVDKADSKQAAQRWGGHSGGGPHHHRGGRFRFWGIGGSAAHASHTPGHNSIGLYNVANPRKKEGGKAEKEGKSDEE
eukprot:TRINITY_DN95296_c0_g1_i1.p1 TRINITY_DN95296_c0_g1~~TRINITY_DN95296_c0_g1_i1.p1  ORF type:complete len:140 (+),score=35.62 TRINITY_DN95296_c0_g1_i1:71-490(+)